MGLPPGEDNWADLLAQYDGSGLPPERAALLAQAVVHVHRRAALNTLIEDGLAALHKRGWADLLNERELEAMGYEGTLGSLSEAKARALAEKEGKEAGRIIQRLGQSWPRSPSVRRLRNRAGRASAGG
ncbi:MAG: hypothetical protein ACOC7T_05275 [Planctomycetota bacterium]